MKYNSTRDHSVSIESSSAIAAGISADGGLFVPETIPALTGEELNGLAEQTYVQRAAFVLGKYLTDFSKEEIEESVHAAYDDSFDSDNPAPLEELSDGVYMLELWHGPTCAFKDMALQLLPQLLTKSMAKTAPGVTAVILVATSGDTGKAALEGFRDKKGTKILVFYPQFGVSDMQKLQMATQEGQNVGVCAIKGNFDDAQNGVKQIFADGDVAAVLQKNGMQFSSANSINWGRLVPQIVYYVSAYCDLLGSGRIRRGQGFNVVVPTGNFGNILAAYYAKKMGVPIAKLICASNANNVLTEFLQTGRYNRNRSFYSTISPSMDILISSNLERLLYDLTGDDQKVSSWMKQLARDGCYEVDDQTLSQLKELFYAGYCDDADTKQTIQTTYENLDYLCDPHTAVALHVYDQYVAETGDESPVVIVSTASPYKFSKSVLTALQPACACEDEFQLVETLSEVTRTAVPQPIEALQGKPVRFQENCTKEEMRSAVLRMLGLQ